MPRTCSAGCVSREIITGARQVGKTTLITQVAEQSGLAHRFASTDEPTLRGGFSPKLQILNTALMTAGSGLTLAQARADREFWGRLVETAVGAHLANAAASGSCEVFYWRDRNREVDFVVRAGRAVTAIEVKSSGTRQTLPGMAAFADVFRPDRSLLVGGDGIAVDEFLSKPAEHWVRQAALHPTGSQDVNPRPGQLPGETSDPTCASIAPHRRNLLLISVPNDRRKPC